MALPPLADVDALAAWLGVTIDTDIDVARAGAVLASASATARRQTGHLYVDEEGELTAVPDDVTAVVVQLAARLWSNPTGATQQTEGPFSITHGPGALTDDERALITPGATGGLGSIKMRAPSATSRAGWSDPDDA
mgnify:CR=1 FL=1